MRRRCGGNMILESALWIPVMTILVVFVIQFGKITYTYYALRNSLYTTGQYLSTQNTVNFCDLAGDPTIQAAINLGVTGTADASAPPLISNLTPDLVAVNIECIDPTNPAVPGPCSAPCGGLGPGPHPDYVVVTIPNGYSVTPRMLYLTLSPILLSPVVTVPFRGTSL
ncbi:MAG TPA: hypothetical protein VML19_15130 [Verrucomicrobiae bacterium]|nr:hypothetical protein [Verrucomicrobiae bacterium]